LETLTAPHPFKKVIVYEPGVSINWNWDWIADYEKALEHQKYRQAFTVFVQGMGHSPLNKAPKWLASFILRIAIRGKDWELKKKLLVSNLREHLEVRRLEDSYRKYSGISVPVLLAGGQASPDFIHRMLDVLAGAIPGSQVILLPKLQHLAPQNGDAPKLVADKIRHFLN
jgi:pimeloyl-ACP methyl ester carboxylesterase